LEKFGLSFEFFVGDVIMEIVKGSHILAEVIGHQTNDPSFWLKTRL